MADSRPDVHVDVVVVGSGAGGGTLARGLAGVDASVLVVERGGWLPAGEAELGPDRGLAQAALPQRRDVDQPQGRGLPALHALHGRRQHEVLGRGALPAPRGGLHRGRARRRGLPRVADRLRDARAVVRRGRAPLPGARRGGQRPDRPRPQAVPAPAGARTSPRSRPSSSRLPRAGRHAVVPPARADLPGRARRLHPVQHLQLLPVPGARQGRRRHGGPVPRARRRQRQPLDRLQGRAGPHRRLGAAGHRRRRTPWGRPGDRPRGRGRALRRRGELRGADAAQRHRPPSRRAGQQHRARGPPLHGPPRDDDGGVPPAPGQPDGLPEDRRHQRLLPLGTGTARTPSATSSPRAGRTRRSSRRPCRWSRCGSPTRSSSAASTGWR